MSSKKYVLIQVSSKEDYKFCKKMYGYFEYKSLVPMYFAANLIIYVYLKFKGEEVYIAKKHQLADVDFKGFGLFNIRSGILEESELGKNAGGFYRLLNKLFLKYDIELCFIPSGRMLSQKILADFAKKSGVTCCYLGYGNFKGKTFLDNMGTDRASSLFLDVKRLDEFISVEDDFEKWKSNYIQSKLLDNTIPQARTLDYAYTLKRLLRITVCKIENIMGLAHDIDYKYKKHHLRVSKFKLSFDSLPSKYIFFPMQLSSDAQIISNYTGDVFDGLKSAINIAKDKGLDLVVKPHPAEIDPLVLKKMEVFKKTYGLYLSNINTFHLIDNCTLVVTINSTVGLEAKLFDKDVIFLGDSLFSMLHGVYLDKYLHGYLVDLDYFDSSSLHVSEFSKLDKILGG